MVMGMIKQSEFMPHNSQRVNLCCATTLPHHAVRHRAFHHCSAAPLPRCSAAPLPRCSAAPLLRCPAAPLLRCPAALPRMPCTTTLSSSTRNNPDGRDPLFSFRKHAICPSPLRRGSLQHRNLKKYFKKAHPGYPPPQGVFAPAHFQRKVLFVASSSPKIGFEQTRSVTPYSFSSPRRIIL